MSTWYFPGWWGVSVRQPTRVWRRPSLFWRLRIGGCEWRICCTGGCEWDLNEIWACIHVLVNINQSPPSGYPCIIMAAHQWLCMEHLWCTDVCVSEVEACMPTVVAQSWNPTEPATSCVLWWLCVVMVVCSGGCVLWWLCVVMAVFCDGCVLWWLCIVMAVNSVQCRVHVWRWLSLIAYRSFTAAVSLSVVDVSDTGPSIAFLQF